MIGTSLGTGAYEPKIRQFFELENGKVFLAHFQPYHSSSTICANNGCGKIGVNMKCGRCKVKVYCGKKCQTEHWKRFHKFVCIPFEN